MHEERTDQFRRVYPVAVRQREARDRAPYLTDLKRWRASLLNLRAQQQFSRHQSTSGLMDGSAQLKALQREIQMARQAFILEMDDIRDTPAVVDYLAALDSMI